MWATKSALIWGMRHSRFCRGLRMFFQVAATLSHGTALAPAPIPPPCPASSRSAQ